MKNILFSFIFALSCSISSAQNSVTVSQQGSGNNANITQGDGQASSSEKEMKTPCSEAANKSKLTNRNSITVQWNGKTVIDTTRSTKNSYQAVAGEKNELSAFQYGSANNLSLLLPDRSGTNNRLAAYQNGTGNMLSAILYRSHQNLNLSQSGNDNSISINPCDDRYDERPGDAGQHNTAIVKQSGKGNSVSINQQ